MLFISHWSLQRLLSSRLVGLDWVGTARASYVGRGLTRPQPPECSLQTLYTLFQTTMCNGDVCTPRCASQASLQGILDSNK